MRLPAFPVDPNGTSPNVSIPVEASDEINFVQSRLHNYKLTNIPLISKST